MWTHSFVILIFDVSSIENRWRISFNSNINFQLRDFRNFWFLYPQNLYFLLYQIKNWLELDVDEYLSNSCKQFYNTCVNIGKNRRIKFENLIHFQEMSYFVDYLTWQCLDTHARVTILANFMRRRCEILFGMLFNFCHILFLGKKCFALSAFVYFAQFILLKLTFWTSFLFFDGWTTKSFILYFIMVFYLFTTKS